MFFIKENESINFLFDIASDYKCLRLECGNDLDVGKRPFNLVRDAMDSQYY